MKKPRTPPPDGGLKNPVRKFEDTFSGETAVLDWLGSVDMPDTTKCPVCGETDPTGAWLCLARLAGAAKPGEPCSYSLEGHTRFVAKMRAKLANEIGIARIEQPQAEGK